MIKKYLEFINEGLINATTYRDIYGNVDIEEIENLFINLADECNCYIESNFSVTIYDIKINKELINNDGKFNFTFTNPFNLDNNINVKGNTSKHVMDKILNDKNKFYIKIILTYNGKENFEYIKDFTESKEFDKEVNNIVYRLNYTLYKLYDIEIKENEESKFTIQFFLKRNDLTKEEFTKKFNEGVETIYKDKSFKTDNIGLTDIKSLDNFKQSILFEFKDSFSLSKDSEKEKFNYWDNFFNDNTFNKSKYLLLNDEIIGGCLIYESNLSDYVNINNMEKNKNIKDLKIETPISYFKNKNGIYVEYFYIDSKYKNKGYSKYLLDYINNNFKEYDYIWGISYENKIKFWINKANRKVVLEYLDISDDVYGRTFITYKKI